VTAGRPEGRRLAAMWRVVLRYRWVALAVAVAVAALSQIPPPH
jgi:uncharacterized protein involved in exopolysaccharide biosynthesis